jgi:hypothetical protein
MGILLPQSGTPQGGIGRRGVGVWSPSAGPCRALGWQALAHRSPRRNLYASAGSRSFRSQAEIPGHLPVLLARLQSG